LQCHFPLMSCRYAHLLEQRVTSPSMARMSSHGVSHLGRSKVHTKKVCISHSLTVHTHKLVYPKHTSGSINTTTNVHSCIHTWIFIEISTKNKDEDFLSMMRNVLNSEMRNIYFRKTRTDITATDTHRHTDTDTDTDVDTDTVKKCDGQGQVREGGESSCSLGLAVKISLVPSSLPYTLKHRQKCTFTSL
jgi:hypothetical protein